MRPLSLAYLTSAPLPPVDALRLAARTGYTNVGLRIAPATPDGDFSPLITDQPMLRETIAAIAEEGVSVFDVEIIRIGADFAVATYDGFLDVCAALGARAILVAGDDPDPQRLIASFAAFCEAAARRNLTADLEFMPWTQVSDCKTAVRIVTEAAQPNGGILVDTLHAARSTTTLADLAAIPRTFLHYGQICDAPAAIPSTTAGLLHTARHARLLPGDGGIDLAGMFAQLPSDLPVSVELPNDEAKARMGVEAWSRAAGERTRRFLGPTART